MSFFLFINLRLFMNNISSFDMELDLSDGSDDLGRNILPRGMEHNLYKKNSFSAQEIDLPILIKSMPI